MLKNVLLCLALGAFITGCNEQHSSATPPKQEGCVALIDLDEVAKRLGRDVTLAAELKSASETLGGKLTATQTEFQNQFNQSKQAIGEAPTDADKQKLAQLERTLNLQLQQKQQEAQAELGSKRVAIVTRFREEVKPIAREIASQRGLDVVLIKSDAMLLVNETGVDITDAVVAKMIASPAAPASSPAAQLPTPPATPTPGK